MLLIFFISFHGGLAKAARKTRKVWGSPILLGSKAPSFCHLRRIFYLRRYFWLYLRFFIVFFKK